MAVDNDEFDVDIESAIFDIENEDFEASPCANLSGTGLSADMGKMYKTDSGQPIVTNAELNSGHQAGASVNDHSADDQKSQEDNNDPLMDDECDELFTQIDENEIRKVVREKEIVTPISDVFKKPLNYSEISPRKRATDDETSSFFATQDNSKDNPPLKRRFPGPAGLLPHLQREELKFINMAPHPLYEKVSKAVSQHSENNSSSSSRKSSMPFHAGKERGNTGLLSKAPWKSMIKTLNLNIKDDNDLLNILNIKWVRAKAKRFKEEMKIPFLAVVVQGELEVTSSKKNFRYKNPSVKLMDPSGTIVAAFNPNFVETYGDKIVPGTALALRNCGFLRLKNNIILTVAKKNLVCLATTKEIEEENCKRETTCSGGELKIERDVFILQNSPLLLDKIREEYREISDKLVTSKDDVQDQNEHPNRITNGASTEYSNRTSLFSTVNSTTRAVGFNDRRLAAVNPGGVPAVVTSSHQFQRNGDPVANFSVDTSSGFDDDDDDALLQALEYVDFVIDEDSM